MEVARRQGSAVVEFWIDGLISPLTPPFFISAWEGAHDPSKPPQYRPYHLRKVLEKTGVETRRFQP